MVESSEFVIGVKQMKMACMAAGVENGKQEVREQVIAGNVSPQKCLCINQIRLMVRHPNQTDDVRSNRREGEEE